MSQGAQFQYIKNDYNLRSPNYIFKVSNGYRDTNYGEIVMSQDQSEWQVKRLNRQCKLYIVKTFKVEPHWTTPDKITDFDIKRALNKAKKWIKKNG